MQVKKKFDEYKRMMKIELIDIEEKEEEDFQEFLSSSSNV